MQKGLGIRMKMVDRPPLHGAIVFRSDRACIFMQFPLFFSHDGKETKDLAPSMLPPHKMLAHPRRWGGPSHRSNSCRYSFTISAKGKIGE
jgi:hypothetical protein